MMKYRWGIAILFFLAGGVIMSFIFVNSRKDTIKDVEEKVGLDFSTCMTVADFKTYIEYGENSGEVKLIIEENIEEIKLELGEKFGRNLIDMEYTLQYGGYSLWEEVQNSKIIAWYEKAIPGKRIKTVVIDIILVEDAQGDAYLYIFY